MAEAGVLQASEAAQIAEVLGLQRPASFDELKLVDTLREGVPARSAERVARAIDPSGALIKASDLVPRSTLHRAEGRHRPLSTEASARLWQVARVFVEARRQYGEVEAAVDFLFRPHPLIQGRRPFDLARETAAGSSLVLALLARAEAGMAV